MTNSKVWIAVIVVAIIAIGGLLLPANDVQLNVDAVARVVAERLNLGAFVGPDIYDEVRFFGDTVDGGEVVSTTTAGSITLTQSLNCDYAVVTLAPSASSAAFNVTTVSSSTLDNCLPLAGMSREFLVRNTGAAATTSTFVAGTGITLLEHDGGDVVIPGGEWARVITTNVVDGSVYTIEVDSVRDAD